MVLNLYDLFENHLVVWRDKRPTNNRSHSASVRLNDIVAEINEARADDTRVDEMDRLMKALITASRAVDIGLNSATATIATLENETHYWKQQAEFFSDILDNLLHAGKFSVVELPDRYPLPEGKLTLMDDWCEENCLSFWSHLVSEEIGIRFLFQDTTEAAHFKMVWG